MRYFRRFWNETPGGNRHAWGTSWWYFETDAKGCVTRQIELYESGLILRYDETKIEDELGGLSESALDLDDFLGSEITNEEFDRAWGKK